MIDTERILGASPEVFALKGRRDPLSKHRAPTRCRFAQLQAALRAASRAASTGSRRFAPDGSSTISHEREAADLMVHGRA
jgi:hypothetical protein